MYGRIGCGSDGRAVAVGFVLAAFAAPVSAQVTGMLSLDSNGVQGQKSSFFCALSGDGRRVAFDSDASNLVAGDTNLARDVFLRDRVLGTTECLSVDSNGAEANGRSDKPRLSVDARYVAFSSSASNLVAADTNACTDVFVRDRGLGTTERVSIDSSGAEANDQSYYPEISADGRFVAFASLATNLVPGDTNGWNDAFLRDRQLGTTELVSVGIGGASANGACDVRRPSISADGRFVAFASAASNLVPGDTNGRTDVFVRDRVLGTTERVSLGQGGVQGDFHSTGPSMSSDGRYVAFDSGASNLVPVAVSGVWDVYLRDRQLGTTELVSVGWGGPLPVTDGSYDASISADGRYVAFWSYAWSLVPGDTNASIDAFVRDRGLATTERISVDSSGSQGNEESGLPCISADGRCVVFQSGASNLVWGDTNALGDVFFRDRLGAPSFSSLCDPGMDGVRSCPCSNPPTGSGRGCDNSAGTGGATLSAAGGTYLSSDSLVFTTSGEKPTALSILYQGTTLVSAGVAYGQGVRCAAGSLKRLFSKNAAGGSIRAPDFGAGEPPVSARSAAKGDPIAAGQSRWYFVVYRDPVVLGGCPASSGFNATQAGQISWAP